VRADLLPVARSIQKEVSFLTLGDRTLSAAEILHLLAQAVAHFDRKRGFPEELRPRFLFGPSSTWSQPVQEAAFAWPRWTAACREFLQESADLGRIPAAVWVAGKAVAPEDFAATLGALVESLIVKGAPPEKVALRKGAFTAERYVAEDTPGLWGWVIFPENFRAPKMMELGRLQAWTIKPALLSPSRS
jgi:hypothetical protein